MPTPTLLPALHRGVRGPVVVAVMDGVGIGTGDAGDAVAQAKTPMLDALARQPLHCALRAHGLAVGLPPSDMGNSEVGHNALGAGRIFDQGAKRVADALRTQEVFAGKAWGELVGHVHRHNSTLHLIGLLSDGNVHSHIDHTLAILARADAEGILRVRLHVLLDGRDVARTSAHLYLRKLEATLNPYNQLSGRDYRIASGGGRMQLTMDRYGADWPMVARGWATHVRGEGRRFVSAAEALGTLRAEQPGIGDQELPGFVIGEDDKPIGAIVDGDAVLVTNFRGDRVLELCAAFEDEDFAHFARGTRPKVHFVGITLYDGEAHRPRNFLVDPPRIEHTLPELLSARGIAQLACSETQKFGHVTYFWNGNRSEPFDAKLEHHIEVPSRPAPFDAHPEMRAQEIVQATLAGLAARNFGMARINLPNGDMVGHTGNFAATVLAMQSVDRAIAQLAHGVVALRGALIVTADHGNAEDMVERDKHSAQPLLDAQGRMVPKTSHTTNPVPCSVVLAPQDAERFELDTAVTDEGGLANVAATALSLMGLEAPREAFLPSLIRPRS